MTQGQGEGCIILHVGRIRLRKFQDYWGCSLYCEFISMNSTLREVVMWRLGVMVVVVVIVRVAAV